ncbi:MAG: pyridoxal phosphate-dependent class II aminotransferase [Synergistaceae bacterium]|nr:pyridoxal phosphate-dependent class II aminotransferase [Synergistaceae bacterium]
MKNIMTLHGANPENLYRLYGLPVPEKIIDFSTNTNVLSWPDIKIDVERLASNYPDPECTELREIIASRENISPSRVLFTNGINQAIFLLSRVFDYGNVGVFQPCYTEYSRAFGSAADISVEDIKSFNTVIITNPNNPTGKFIPDFSRVITANPHTHFIVDEAYIDFLRGREPERLTDFPNVIILRSLTKIFSLSGARIGYVIADEKTIDKMKSYMPSWSVNAFAQELALRFLCDDEFLERTQDFYRLNTPIFIESLRSEGFEVLDSDVHYFLVRVNDDMKVIRHLLTRGIAVRHTRNFRGLDGKYIRVATRQPEENRLFVEAMREIAREVFR